MRKSIIASIVGLVLFCGYIYAQVPALNTGEWGECGNGLRLKIDTPKQIYKVGEIIPVTFSLQNTSTQSYTITSSRYYGFLFTDAEGHSIDQKPPADPNNNMELWDTELAPQQLFQYQIFLNQWHLADSSDTFVKIGDSARSLTISGAYNTPEGDYVIGGIWLGIVYSMPISIQITE